MVLTERINIRFLSKLNSIYSTKSLKPESNMISLVFLCLTIFSGLASAQAPGTDQVVTDRSKFAYQVSLQFRGSHVCGGAILDEQNILTAANCVVSGGKILNSTLFTVITGGLNIFNDPNNVAKEVAKIFVYADYDEVSQKNDLAVLRIDGKFSFTERVKSVELAGTVDSTTQGVVSGWGTTVNPNEEATGDLKSVTVPFFPLDTCKQSYDKIGMSLEEGVLCAGTFSKNSCQGVAGDPLVRNAKLAGVVSYGSERGIDRFPGVYTDVSKYVEWINAQKAKSSGLKSSLSLSLVVGVLVVKFLNLL